MQEGRPTAAFLRMRIRCKEGVACLRIRPFYPSGRVCFAEEAPSGLVSLLQSTGKQPHVFLVKMGTKQSRLRRKDEKPPSELLGWRKRRTDDNAPSEKEKEGAAHAVGQAATPSPGINI